MKHPCSGRVDWLPLAPAELFARQAVNSRSHAIPSQGALGALPAALPLPPCLCTGEVDRLELAYVQERAAPDLGRTCKKKKRNYFVNVIFLGNYIHIFEFIHVNSLMRILFSSII